MSIEPSTKKREASEEPTHAYSTRSGTAAKQTSKNIVPRLKALPYSKQDLYNGVRAPPKHTAYDINAGEKQIDFYRSDDHPFNRRGFKYKPCAPDPMFPSLMYGTTDLPPHSVRFSYFDRSAGSYLNDDMRVMASDQGWRSCRTNVGIREGKYYVEFKIIKSNEDSPDFAGHVRIGIARKEASIEAPVGFDGYGYGLRDKTGQKLHLSRPTEFMKNGFTTGDVIGMLVELPSLDIQKKISQLQINKKIKSDPLQGDDAIDSLKDVAVESIHATEIVRDQIPIRYKNQLFFEQYEYTVTNPIEHLLNPVTVFGEKAIPDKDKFKPAYLPESKVTFFKNGKLVGVAFEDLYAFLPPNSEQNQNAVIASQKKSNSKKATNSDEMAMVFDDATLGYYPMVSSFRNGCVEINPGPDFMNAPEDILKKIASGEVHPLSDRYEEKVIQDIVLDIVDEIDSEYLDTLEK